MSMRFVEGPAGSGKTTRLMTELSSVLNDGLEDQQRVLALTRMHGSRRRLQARLAGVGNLRGQFDCQTVDGFAWRLVRRWRSRVQLQFGVVPDSFEDTCTCAGKLLSDPLVSRWVTRRYPIVIVDEMQDSKGGQLSIIQGLSATATCLAAADDFQDLDVENAQPNPAVTWARQGEVVALDKIHRTSICGLLDAANSLRQGRPIAKGTGFSVLGAPNHNVGASFVAKNLTWWKSHGTIAIISPVRQETSAFVRDLLKRVEEKPFEKNGQTWGPHTTPWETSQEAEQRSFAAQLGLPDDAASVVSTNELVLPDDSEWSEELRRWTDRMRRLSGRSQFSAGELRGQVRLILQRSRARGHTSERGVRAMTVHQAKNREFDSVIVLWPYEVQAGDERQRRILYNAVTRAKRQALVVVQNAERVKKPPFSMDAA